MSLIRSLAGSIPGPQPIKIQHKTDAIAVAHSQTGSDKTGVPASTAKARD